VKKRITFFLLCGLALTGAYAQQAVNQYSDGGTPWGYKHSEYEAEIPFVQMPAFDVEPLRQQDALNDNNKAMPFRFGYNHMVTLNLQNSGYWMDLPDGGRVWRLGISSPGALSINLAFRYVSLPEGAKLFVYNASHTVSLGAFTQKHISADYTFGTELVEGDAIIVELYEPAERVGQSSLEIFRVTHRYRSIDAFLERSFGDSDNCMNNVRCPAYAGYDDQIRSVVCLVSGGSEFCTGALINNTCNDGTPYVLTANHCGSSGFGSWIFRFNWESSGCSDPPSSPSSNSISGGTQRAANPGSDMSLVEITAANAETVLAGYGVFYAGWDRQNNTTNNAYGIHHPSGDIKKISFTTGPTVSASYAGATCWRTGTWTDGVTEPGSSGSPLFNSSGQIIGQLYGGPSSCSQEGNATNGVDYYGKLFTSWTGGGSNSSRLSNWLDACSTGATSNNGYDPNASSLAWDVLIQSITTPAGTVCSGNVTPVVVLKNNGTNTVTSVTINYSVDGGANQAYNWTGSLASGNSTNVSLPVISLSAGPHTYAASTSGPNGNADQNTANDASSSSFTVASATGTALPFTEGFEGAFPPSGWANENPDNNAGSALWVRTTTASGFGNSTASAKIDQGSPGSTTAGQVDNLVTPYINLSSASNPVLTFSVANARYNASFYDSLTVWITTNCGGTWTRLASYGSNTGASPLATAPDATSPFTPTASQWATKTISLSAYASQSAVRVRFQLRSGWGNNTYIDDINISGSGSGMGLEDGQEELITVYPNPVSEQLTLRNPLAENDPYTLYLMDAAGRVIRTSQVTGVLHTVDMSALAPGTYLVRLLNSQYDVVKRVMVVR